jgi:hypothetical protein
MPELNKKLVPTKGKFQGFIDSIPMGGQILPNSIFGDKDECK